MCAFTGLAEPWKKLPWYGDPPPRSSDGEWGRPFFSSLEVRGLSTYVWGGGEQAPPHSVCFSTPLSTPSSPSASPSGPSPTTSAMGPWRAHRGSGRGAGGHVRCGEDEKRTEEGATNGGSRLPTHGIGNFPTQDEHQSTTSEHVYFEHGRLILRCGRKSAKFSQPFVQFRPPSAFLDADE